MNALNYPFPTSVRNVPIAITALSQSVPWQFIATLQCGSARTRHETACRIFITMITALASIIHEA
jgi:hypothetical protein